MASFEKCRVIFRETHVVAHALVPLVGDGYQVAVGGRPQRLDQRWQRVAEMLVLAAAETVPPHDHLAAEAFLLMAQTRNCLRLSMGQEFRHDGPTLGRRDRRGSSPSPRQLTE